MDYTAQFNSPESGLELILTALQKFDQNRFLYAVKYKNYDENQVLRLAREIAEYRIKMMAEYKRLEKFAETFNKTLVTNDNKCYSTALLTLKKIGSGISEVKRIYKKFCPRARRERMMPIYGDAPVSAYTHSMICTNEVQLDMYGLDSYSDEIQGLFNEMDKFFALLILSLKLCKRVIQEEAEIRKDEDYCRYLYEQFKKRFMKKIRNILMLINKDSEYLTEKMNPIIAYSKKCAPGNAIFSQILHNYSVEETEHYVLYEIQDEEKYGDMTPLEHTLFGSNMKRTLKVRYLIDHFDELMPKDKSYRKLDSTLIVMFMKWCQISAGNEVHFVEYFNKRYSNQEGHIYSTVTNAAVNSRKNRMLKSPTSDKGYNDFVNDINRILSHNINLSKASGF